MNVGVLVPVAIGEDEWRSRAWMFTRRRLWAQGLTVYAGRGVPDWWSKGGALADARGLAGELDVVVMHDADVLVSAEALAWSIEQVAGGRCAWSVPHLEVHRLDRDSTVRVLRSGAVPVSPGYARIPYRGVVGGGIVVVSGAVWAECPVDPRFVGWGGEDESWGWALSCLYGPPQQGTERLWHLWHPHAAPGARRPPRAESEALRRAYRNARGVPRLMRAVIAGRRPDPPVPLEIPARFVASGGLVAFNVLGQLVRIRPGEEYSTVDSDMADVLDRTAGVARAVGSVGLSSPA